MKAAEFRAARQGLGCSQAEFADELGATKNSVARWERGEIPIPGTVAKLAALLVTSRAGRPRYTGAARDDHHQMILDRLCGRLDPAMFEACAASLLRDLHPHLVPVRGGTDDGFDGEQTSSSGELEPLIVTTARNYRSNLTKSLRKARNVGSFSHAIFATSQRVTARGRQDLRKFARGLGVDVLEIYDQDWFGETLYHSADWAKSLLGVTGRPSALCPFPIDRSRRRPLSQLLGRDAELERLIHERQDVVIEGGPGFGKTALLEVLAGRLGARFLVDHDRDALARAIRLHRPEVVIVDDAFIRRSALDALVQLRTECNAHFRIIACCWPCHTNQVKRIISRDTVTVVPLELVDADTVVEIVKLAGVRGPAELLRLIVGQAEGRPGLAVTLARLCMTSFESVWSGQALFEHLCPIFQAELDKDVARLLGCFSLGGNGGFDPSVVAEFLRQPLDDVTQALAALAQAGVIRVGFDGCVSVWPLPFRFTLVREAFFGEARLALKPLLERAPNHLEAVDALIGARSRGAAVNELDELVRGVNAPTVWSHYALLGPDEARFAIRNASCSLTEIAQPILTRLPEEAVPKLLQLAEDGRPGVLECLKTWTRETDQVDAIIQRSKILVEAIARRYASRSAPAFAVDALCLALDPGFELTSTDPGQGRTFTFTIGAVPGTHLQQLVDLWPTVLSIIAHSSDVPWNRILEIVNQWRCPDPRLPLDEETSRLKEDFAERMARDLVVVAGDHEGVKHRIRDIAKWMDLQLDVKIGKEFALLFPSMPLGEGIDWEAEHKRQAVDADSLGRSWQNYSPVSLAEKLQSYARQASQAKVHAPNLIHVAVRGLAAAVSEPRVYLESFAKLGASADVVAPFAERVAAQDVVGLVQFLLATSGYETLALRLLLNSDSVDLDMLDRCLERASDPVDAVEWAWYSARPEVVVRHLLSHSDVRIALAAAAHEFRHEKPFGARPGISKDWRRAILRSAQSEVAGELHWLEGVLCMDASLANEWLCVFVGDEQPRRYRLAELAKKAANVLSTAQRASVLSNLRGAGVLHGLVSRLVGDDPDLYRMLLRNSQAKRYHLAPLAGTPSEHWANKIILAHEAGYEPTELASATFPHMRTWSGAESEYWKPFAEAFQKFVNHENSCVRIAAEHGLRRIKVYVDDALCRERLEAIRGIAAE
jgi:transcriptional regulator with XRE-family HTH domain